MKPVIFKGYDVALNAPKDWKPSRDGSCSALCIRRTEYGGHPAMLSYWKPDADELRALNEGYSVCLGIVGQGHPPVFMMVQRVEEHEIPDNLIPKGCPYCTSDNEAIRSTYYDQTCKGCVKRMGEP